MEVVTNMSCVHERLLLRDGIKRKPLVILPQPPTDPVASCNLSKFWVESARAQNQSSSSYISTTVIATPIMLSAQECCQIFYTITFSNNFENQTNLTPDSGYIFSPLLSLSLCYCWNLGCYDDQLLLRLTFYIFNTLYSLTSGWYLNMKISSIYLLEFIGVFIWQLLPSQRKDFQHIVFNT